jgi:hypothetical protein
MNTKQQFNSLSNRTSDLEKQIKTIQGGNSADWSAITNKPPTFPPSAHTHLISDVTNLQTTLDGKSNTGHTHDYSTLTSIPSTFTPSTHTHAISDVTNLQTILDGKVDETASTVSGNLNTYVTSGFYYVPANTTNAPTTLAYDLIVTGNGTQAFQLAIYVAGGTVTTRTTQNGGSTWSSWVNVPTASQYQSYGSNLSTNILTAKALYDLGYNGSTFDIQTISTAFDLNTTSANTVIRYLTGALTNQPNGVTTGILFHQYRVVSTTDYIQHVITNETTPRYFMRTKTAGTWGSWTQINDWNSISNKPSTFPPSAHTHAEIGTLASLTTTNQTDLVSAINEVNAKPSGGGVAYNSFADLNNWIS